MACIYLLEDSDGFGYIGSTCNLKQRLRNHNRKYNDCKSKCLKKPFTHLVLEEIDDIDNLEFAEQFYIKLYKSLYNDKLLNKIIPLRTEKEYYTENREKLLQQTKQYRSENREKLSQQTKQHYSKNKDKILQQTKQYYSKNKERILQRNKEYNIKNKDKILQQKKEYNKQKTECACGSLITIGSKSKHLTSNKHINFTNNKL